MIDELTVGRINVQEPNGTLRLVLASRAAFPGLFQHRTETPHPRTVAGLIFLNDEGTEQGGLLYDGRRGPDGQVQQGLQLSFDKYDQDQTLLLTSQDQSTDQESDAGQSETRLLVVTDRPDWPVAELAQVTAGLTGAELDAAVATFFADGRAQAQHRLLLGKRRDGTVGLTLNDPQGRPRLRLQVDAAGNPSIELLDEAGRVRTDGR